MVPSSCPTISWCCGAASMLSFFLSLTKRILDWATASALTLHSWKKGISFFISFHSPCVYTLWIKVLVFTDLWLSSGVSLFRPVFLPSCFPSVKREFFLPTIGKCLQIGGYMIWGGFLTIIVGSLPYNNKHLELIAVVNWCHRNQIELNQTNAFHIIKATWNILIKDWFSWFQWELFSAAVKNHVQKIVQLT